MIHGALSQENMKQIGYAVAAVAVSIGSFFAGKHVGEKKKTAAAHKRGVTTRKKSKKKSAKAVTA